MTTIKITGGDLGKDSIMVCCDLSRAESPVQINYCNGDSDDWEYTPFQCADCRHSARQLAEFGKYFAAKAVGIDEDEFDCEWEEVSE